MHTYLLYSLSISLSMCSPHYTLDLFGWLLLQQCSNFLQHGLGWSQLQRFDLSSAELSRAEYTEYTILFILILQLVSHCILQHLLVPLVFLCPCSLSSSAS